jgi:hypothetical protein
MTFLTEKLETIGFPLEKSEIAKFPLESQRSLSSPLKRGLGGFFNGVYKVLPQFKCKMNHPEGEEMNIVSGRRYYYVKE